MNEGQFSARAAILWGAIPLNARERILKNVWCTKCRGTVEILAFTGEEKDGDLILTGSCSQCGNKVARVIETSEHDLSGN